MNYRGHEKQCYECNRLFFVPDLDSYAYRRDTKYFCKWSCMRAYDARKHPQTKKIQS